MSPFFFTKLLRTTFFHLSIFGFLSSVIPASFILLSPQNVYSADVTLAWDENGPRDVGYRIFYRQEGQEYNYEVPDWEGTETRCTIYGLDNNTTYYFVARAFDSYLESSDSNEVCYYSYSVIPQSELSIVSVDSEELVDEDGAAENAIDGWVDTIWHTEWYQSAPTCPHEIVIDLGDVYVVGGFQYLPRQDGRVNGTVADYSIYVSEDTFTWGESVATGTFASGNTEKEVMFAGKIGRYVRFVALSEVNGNNWTSAAEINIRGTFIISPPILTPGSSFSYDSIWYS